MSRLKNDADLSLRERHEKMRRVKNGTDLFLRVRQDKKSRVERCTPVAKSKTRQEE